MMITDQESRDLALDPTTSFLVQAPAGSGKTSLLVQRFLRLLLVVEEPEHIIALTFTQKAAQEMRHRVIQALMNAASENQDAITCQLASQVKTRDQDRHWGLLLNPKRLRMMTMDAFCLMINRMMPLASGMGGVPKLVDNPLPIYREAVRQLLNDLGQDLPWAEALKETLLYFDNRVDLFESLFLEMCAVREQWLEVVLSIKQHDLTALITQSLMKLSQIRLDALLKQWPASINLVEFFELMNGNVLNSQGLVFNYETLWGKSKTVQHWKWVAGLCLTRAFTVRKIVTAAEGFFSASEKGLSTEEREDRKNRKFLMLNILEQLRKTPRMERLLGHIVKLPEISGSIATSITQSILTLLPVLAAYCQLQFQNLGQVDFIEMALRALQSLKVNISGEVSDLTLALDYQIQHLLIDEFQDTSLLQFRLLEALVQGWEPGDGRSLFCVGDPMQSIYRFRKAEVSLFSQVQVYGLARIKPRMLYLSANFRSHERLVDMVNRYFAPLAPHMEGEIQYRAASACCDLERGQIRVLLHEDELAEAETLCNIIQAWRQDAPESSIAILVRVKRHAEPIIRALVNAKIPYQAEGLEELVDRSTIQDLIALASAMMHEGDAIAWYSILRAPWSGLLLEDLLVISHYCRQHQTMVIESLNRLDLRQQLNNRAQGILARVLPILNQALLNRRAASLARVVEQAWLALGGPYVLVAESVLQEVACFFDILTQVCAGSGSFDRALLIESLSSRHGVEQHEVKGAVRVMTIHKAKGLEFDRVIIPACEKRTQQGERPLLLHQMLTMVERDGTDSQVLALLSVLPIEGRATPEMQALYDYLLAVESDQEADEIVRLFYVACTRAKSYLLCSGVLNHDTQPSASSFLAILWPTVEQDHLLERSAMRSSLAPLEKKSCYRCLPSMPIITVRAHQELYDEDESLNQPLRTGHPDTIARGIVLHEFLYHLSMIPRENWGACCQSSAIHSKMMVRLRVEGIKEQSLAGAADKIMEAARRTCEHALGAWILSQDHEMAASELALMEAQVGMPKLWLIDRLIIDQGICWIIDYKMTEPESLESLDLFFNRMRHTYCSQLRQYEKLVRLWNPSIKEVRKIIFFPSISEYCFA